MTDSLIVIGALISYIAILHFRLWLAEQRLKAARPTLVVSNGHSTTSEPGGCGAFIAAALLLTVNTLYFILSTIQ